MDLGKQYGPLPLGAWIAVVAGGLGIALWTKQGGSSPDEEEIVEDTSGDEGVGEGPSWTAVPPPTGAPGGVTYESNEAWGQAAVNYLIAQGYGAALAQSAISKALAGGVDIDGNKMSIQEWALWSLALTKFGSPPYPVFVAPPTTVPGPVTPNDPPPTTDPPGPKPPDNKVPPHHVVKAVRGDSISKIAAKYGKGWKETWDFNLKYRSAATVAIMKARGPNLIFAGTTIWVPK
jgi:LysM repeat protein